MAKQFTSEGEDWTNIAQSLRTAGMNEEDVDVAGKLGGATHTLDELVFQNPAQFVFYPSRSDKPSAGGYLENRYFVYVEGQCNALADFQNELGSSWPPQVSWTVDEELCLYSLAVEIVRLRAQEEFSIELFSSKHVGKITKIPILNKIIEANTRIFGKSNATIPPHRFDAHVIGSFAAQILAENKRDGLVGGKQMFHLLVELVKIDAKGLQ